MNLSDISRAALCMYERERDRVCVCVCVCVSIVRAECVCMVTQHTNELKPIVKSIKSNKTMIIYKNVDCGRIWMRPVLRTSKTKSIKSSVFLIGMVEVVLDVCRLSVNLFTCTFTKSKWGHPVDIRLLQTNPKPKRKILAFFRCAFHFSWSYFC